MTSLSPAALAAAQAAAEALYRDSPDDRDALNEAVAAAVGVYLEALWRPVDAQARNGETYLIFGKWGTDLGYWAGEDPEWPWVIDGNNDAMREDAVSHYQ